MLLYPSFSSQKVKKEKNRVGMGKKIYKLLLTCGGDNSIVSENIINNLS